MPAGHDDHDHDLGHGDAGRGDGGGKHARLRTLTSAVVLQRAVVRDNDAYETFRCWRYPKPRQVWLNGKSTAPHHRPATNNDLILDLTIVIVLANMGANFRANIASVPDAYKFNWPATIATVFWNPVSSGAFQNFFNVFLLLIMRWSRICRFDNYWGQRDMVFEVFWIGNIALYALVGAAMVLGQVAPCFWFHRYFLGALLGLDLLLILMNMYHLTLHGIRTGDWGYMRTWLVAEVVLTQMIPMLLIVVFLVDDAATCNNNFCSKGFYLVDDPNAMLTLMAVWDYLGSYVSRLVFFGVARACPAVRKCVSVLPIQVGNLVERAELLLILCLGEQVVALTSLTFTATSLYTELWHNSTLHTVCGADTVEDLVAANLTCFEYECVGVPEDEQLATTPIRELFARPEYEMMIVMLSWIAMFRLAIFEFTEGAESKQHALRRHIISGMTWSTFSVVTTAAVVTLGYTMELVIAGHAPVGHAVPLVLTTAMAMFHIGNGMQKFVHRAPWNPQPGQRNCCKRPGGPPGEDANMLWPTSVQLFLHLILASLAVGGLWFFPAPESADEHAAEEGTETNTSSSGEEHSRRWLSSSSEESSSHTSSAEALDYNLVYYLTALLAASVLLDYIQRAEYRNLNCSCRRDPRHALKLIDESDDVVEEEDGVAPSAAELSEAVDEALRDDEAAQGLHTLTLAQELHRRLNDKDTRVLLERLTMLKEEEHAAMSGGVVSGSGSGSKYHLRDDPSNVELAPVQQRRDHTNPLTAVTSRVDDVEGKDD